MSDDRGVRPGCYNTAYLLLLQWVPFGAILAGGDEAQKQRFLPGLAAGELRSAISLTEPQSGSDVAGIRTRARREPGGYRLTGSKIWCTNAPVADFVLVAAKIDGGTVISSSSTAPRRGFRSGARKTRSERAASPPVRFFWTMSLSPRRTGSARKNRASRAFGTAGISNEMPINRYLRDAKVLQIVEVTNQIQRNIIARNLLGPAR